LDKSSCSFRLPVGQSRSYGRVDVIIPSEAMLLLQTAARCNKNSSVRLKQSGTIVNEGKLWKRVSKLRRRTY